MTQQPTTGALPGTSPTGHQTTHHQIPAVSPPLSGSGDRPSCGTAGRRARRGRGAPPAPASPCSLHRPATLPAPALALGVVHLPAADELCQQGYGSMSAVAVCGELVTEETDDEDPRYCPQCVRAAIRWSTPSRVIRGTL